MFDLIVAAGFEDVHEANDIGIDVGMRIFKAVANAGLGGKIDYPIKSVFGKDLFDGSAIAQVSLNEGKALMIAENGEAIMFQLHLVVIVEIIKTHDLVATLEKVNGEMKADKPRCARNQNLHRLLLLINKFLKSSTIKKSVLQYNINGSQTIFPTDFFTLFVSSAIV